MNFRDYEKYSINEEHRRMKERRTSRKDVFGAGWLPDMGGDARARGGVTSIAALPNRSNGTTDADDSVFTQLALFFLFTVF